MPQSATSQSLPVPLDHEAAGSPLIDLPYFVVGAFDRSKPTVMIVADGQQFYVRVDVLPTFRDVFGDDVNIVGLPGRGSSEQLRAALGDPASDKWSKAYQLLQFRQWTADIDAVRRALVGADGLVMIYGVSGGGQLAHQYLSAYGSHVARCYTEAAVFSVLEAQLGLQHDRFWSEITPEQQDQLRKALSARPHRRAYYAQLLQRQNFFVEPDALAAERGALIAAIHGEDTDFLERAANNYQVKALNQMMDSPIAWAIRVRQYEFVQPLVASFERAKQFWPDVETSMFWAQPLLELHRRREIAAPTLDMRTWHRVEAEVTLVAGRHDHTCDYRSQIALASHYPAHCLLLLDDDHRLHRWKKMSGMREALLRAWPRGFDDPAFKAALVNLEPLRWREA